MLQECADASNASLTDMVRWLIRQYWQEQYQWLKAAIANWRRVKHTLRRMQQLSREDSSLRCPGPHAARDSASQHSDWFDAGSDPARRQLRATTAPLTSAPAATFANHSLRTTNGCPE